MADPTSATETRRCHHCNANLPLSAYGLFKPDPKGYAKICKLCRSEISATRWTRKYGRRKPLPESITRGVTWHNREILNNVIAKGSMELRGFDVSTKMEYKVFYGPSDRHGLMSFAMFNRTGSLYREWAYSGEVRDPVDTMLAILRELDIRLEWSDLDVINSKTLIYIL